MRILYLDIDTLRPDHLGCYGYHRNTSPNIDRIASEGVRFENYYCPDAPCLPSRSALMSGRFGIHTGVVNHGGLCADPRPEGRERDFLSQYGVTTLPAMLTGQGLHAVYIGGFADRHSSWQFYAGFREIHDTGKRGMESAEDVSPTALDWIERRAKEDNWYLHINYWDPHTPFRAPADFGNPFENDPLPEWCTPELIEEHRKLPGPHTIQDISMYDNVTDPQYPRHPGEVRDMKEMRKLIDGYDCGIRYADEHVGQILAALEKQGVLDDTIIMISSDHGENYGELGLYAEHGTADHATCRIPMIVRWPGCKQGHIDNGLHYNLDLGPTLAELMQFKAPALWEGRSYAPAVMEGAGCGRDSLVLSQCAHVCQRSVRWDDYIWIRTWHDGFHLFDKEMLFNIKNDPHETANLVESRPELCAEARGKYEAWHEQMMETMPAGWG
ncbi:MAG: sulfatase, partial [Verrucomicrobiota bacterium]|nr:sulfatase [Verrucomicrobiota bacterium]